MIAAVLALLLAAPTPAAPQHYYDLGDLQLSNGKTIRDCRIGYRTLGRLNAAKSNVLVWPSFFAGNSQDLIDWATGAHAFFDPAPYFVIAVDSLGDGVSCSPSTSTAQAGPAFPWFTIDDMVAAEHRLLVEHFGLSHVRAIVGVSMGGMQAFSWMVRYPEFAGVAIPLVGSPRLASYDAILWKSLDRAILDDPHYAGGRYKRAPDIVAADAFFSLHLHPPPYWVEHTSRAQAERDFNDLEKPQTGFDANDWRWQMHAMLAQDVARGSTLASAAKKVRAKVLVVTSDLDLVVNPQPALEFARLLGARTIELHGNCGHLAVACEGAKLRPAIDAFLATSSR